MNCAIYCRLSKEDGVFPGMDKAGESESILNQKTMLRQYAEEMGWEIHGMYADEDYSGADRDRPGFRQLLRDAEAGRFRIILCKSQSRFTRDMELVEKYIHTLFPIWGIRFIALLDHADTDVKGNKKARQINGLVNEWYLEDLSENIRAVLDNKRKNGKYIASFPLYGYRKDPHDHNRLLIDPEAAENVRMIFALAECGYGRQRIADYLNSHGIPSPAQYRQQKEQNYRNALLAPESAGWNRTSVGRVLQNEMYTGCLIQGKRKKLSYKSAKICDVRQEDWIRTEHTHEAIIPKHRFDALLLLQRHVAMYRRRMQAPDLETQSHPANLDLPSSE